MNNIIPVSRLGELLSAKTGADVDACIKFVKEYFGLIEATLAAGEDVTIKGIGTFKLTGDEAEPVIYQVDTDLASTVNAPFEAFSAFELTDDELTDATVQEPKPEATQEAEEETKIEIEIEPEPQPEPEPVIITPEPESEPEPEPEPHQESEPQQELDNEPISESDIEQESEVIAEDNHYENYDNYPSGLKIYWLALVFVLGLLLGVAVGYFGHNYINDMITGNTQEELVVATDSIVEPVDSIDDIIEAEPAENIVKEDVTEVSPAPKEPRYDTITGTCYLTTLARKYYGNMDYWVYIYDANDLGNPNRITPGTKVRIPYPEELKLSGDSATDSKAAKRRASEIYAKYK